MPSAWSRLLSVESETDCPTMCCTKPAANVVLRATAGEDVEHGLYAYDAYVLTCALAQRAPVLTLDRGLVHAAISAGVEVMEVQQ